MPEYLAPGVYVEETPLHSKSIEGVSTSTAGFIGPTRYGPVDLDDEILADVLDFERLYGSCRRLDFGGSERHNYVWHAVRAYFAEGGKRLHVCRVFRRLDDSPEGSAPYVGYDSACSEAPYADGHARAKPDAHAGLSQPPSLRLRARYPGAAGNVRVALTLATGQNALSEHHGKNARGQDVDMPAVVGLQNRDVVLISPRPATWSSATGPFYLALQAANGDWSFAADPGGSATALPLASVAAADLSAGVEIRAVTADVAVLPDEDVLPSLVWTSLALDPGHQRDGRPDSLLDRFGLDASDPARNREIPVVLDVAAGDDGLAVLRAILAAGLAAEAPVDIAAALQSGAPPATARTLAVGLQGGNDGLIPTAGEYEGRGVPGTNRKTGLKKLEDLEDISIVAAPGVTFSSGGGDLSPQGEAVIRLLIGHCERMRYRVAVLDAGNGMTVAQVRRMRAAFDSRQAALYYPWVVVTDPLTRRQISVPPSGFVAGTYARNDASRGVHHAPANCALALAEGLEANLDQVKQGALGSEGINTFCQREGRRVRLVAARTMSSDPDCKYVNVHRYFAYLVRSIDRGTQWVAFEPSGETLWAHVRRAVEGFLLQEWRSGALRGDEPDEAFFVRCDRTTMTQADLDSGRIVFLIGVAPLKPADFVIFRIWQQIADPT